MRSIVSSDDEQDYRVENLLGMTEQFRDNSLNSTTVTESTDQVELVQTLWIETHIQ